MSELNPKLFPKLTSEQIERLRPYGDLRTFAVGESLFEEGSPAEGMFIILSGQVKVTRKAGRQDTTLVVHEPGEFTGEIALIAGGRSIATARALTPTETLYIIRAVLSRVFYEQPEIKNILVPAMAARRPEADAQVMQREKLAALGKLSAGLAHELNNPAAAAARASAQLGEIIVRQISQAICMAGGCEDAAAVKIKQMLHDARESNATVTLDALARSDREDEVASWLEAYRVTEPWRLAPDLVDAGITKDCLNQLAALLPKESVGKIAAWLATTITSLSLVTQIEASTSRMSELVKAIKIFSYMDQGPVQDIDVREGLDATLTILAHKLRNVELTRVYDPKLPCVTGRGGDLNQVWANIIVNGIEAMQGHGKLTIRTACERDQALVEITDNGPGIPAEVEPHIFEPFYTTKGVGEGTGLGLDNAYRIIVEQHHGDISVQSKPGATTFHIRLPISTNCPP